MDLHDSINHLSGKLICLPGYSIHKLIMNFADSILEEADRRGAECIKVALTESRDKVQAAESDASELRALNEDLREQIGLLHGDVDVKKKLLREVEFERDAFIRDRDVLLQQANDLRKDLMAADIKRRELEDELRATNIEWHTRGKELAVAIDTVRARDMAIAELQRQLAERPSASVAMPELSAWRAQGSSDVEDVLRGMRHDIGSVSQRTYDAGADLLAALLKHDPPAHTGPAAVDIRERCARLASALSADWDSRSRQAASAIADAIRALDVEDWSDGAHAVLRLEVRVKSPDQVLSIMRDASARCGYALARGGLTGDGTRNDDYGSWRFAVTLRQETNAPAPEIVCTDEECSSCHVSDVAPSIAARVPTILDVATGRIEHRWQGKCPDQSAPDDRDPECEACKIIDAHGYSAMSPKLKAAIDAWRTAHGARRGEIIRYLRTPLEGDPDDELRMSADNSAADVLASLLEEQ